MPALPYRETPLVDDASLRYRPVQVGGAAGDLAAPAPAWWPAPRGVASGGLGGAAGGGGSRAVCWRVRAALPHVIELVEWALGGAAERPSALRLALPGTILPGGVALAPSRSPGGTVVAVACSDGAVYVLSLGGGGSSSLDEVQPESVARIDLPELLHEGFVPTGVELAGDTLCLGAYGADRAGVLCVPLAGDAVGAYELRGSALNKVWEGLRSFAPQKLLGAEPRVVALAARAFVGVARPLVLALHEDGSLRAWDVSGRQVAFTAAMDPTAVDPDVHADGLSPAGMWVDAPPAAGNASAIAVVHYSNASGGGARDVSFAVRTSASGGAVKGSAKAVAALRGVSAGAAGTPLGVVVSDESCWMLVELAATGGHEVRCVAVAGSAAARRCHLLGDDVCALALSGDGEGDGADDIGFAERMLDTLGATDEAMDGDGSVDDALKVQRNAQIAEVFLEGLLSPVTLCGRALRAALGGTGASAAELGRAATRAELRPIVIGAVRAAAAGHHASGGGAAAAELHAWRALCRRYAHEWTMQRAPCGLVGLGCYSGGAVVVSATAVSVLRPQVFHETLRDLASEMAGSVIAPRGISAGGAGAGRTVLQRPASMSASDWQDVQTVCACAAAAEASLGPLPLAAFAPALLRGAETPDLACEYARLLLSGQLGGTGAGMRVSGSAVSRARAAGRRLGVAIAGRLAALRDPARAVALALRCAELPVPAAGEDNDRGAKSFVEAHVMAATAAQAADASLALGRSLLLLSAYACLLRGTPGADAAPGVTASARAAALPEAQALVARLALVRWLATSPCVAPPAGSPASRMLMSTSDKLGGATMILPPTLAALLVRVGRGGAALQRTPACRPGDLPSAAIVTLAVLRWGAMPSDVSMGSQCVGISTELYELGQAAELRDFIGAAVRVLPPPRGSCLGGGGEAAALHFVQGLCHLASADVGVEHEAAAARCFFRASAAIDSIDSAAGNVQGGANAPVSNALALVEPLLAAAAGAPIDSPIPALRRLQYYEASLRLFERRGAQRGAAAFARSAAGAVAAAERAAADAGDEEGLAAARSAGERLWTSAFRHACDVGEWTDAYVAAAANSNPERAVECVRRLASVMAEDTPRGAAEALVALPFARPGLAVAAAAAVRRRAEAAGIEACPPLFVLAYKLLIRRAQRRPAASAALRCARRLAVEAPQRSAERLRFLTLAIDALEQVEEGFQWLDEGESTELDDAAEGGGTMRVSLGATAAGGSEDDAMDLGDLADGEIDGIGAMQALAAVVAGAPQPTTLPELRRERARAAAGGEGAAAQDLAGVAAALARAGDVDLASHAASALQAHSERPAALERVAEELARSAVVAQLSGDSAPTARIAERAWSRLRAFLRSFGTAPFAAALAAAALEAVLTLEPRIVAPAWLESLASADVASLVRVHMRAGRHAAAARAAAASLRTFAARTDARARSRPAAAAFPYTVFDAALEAVRSADGSESGGAPREGKAARASAATELEAALAERLQTAARDQEAALRAMGGASQLAVMTGGGHSQLAMDAASPAMALMPAVE